MNRSDRLARLPFPFRRDAGPSPGPHVGVDFPGGNAEDARFMSPGHLRLRGPRGFESPAAVVLLRDPGRGGPERAVRPGERGRVPGPAPGLADRAAGVQRRRGPRARRVTRRRTRRRAAPGGISASPFPRRAGAPGSPIAIPTSPGTWKRCWAGCPTGWAGVSRAAARRGRAVLRLRLGNHESPRRAVWILARQHAGETPASFAAEGLLELLAGERLLPPRHRLPRHPPDRRRWG